MLFVSSVILCGSRPSLNPRLFSAPRIAMPVFSLCLRILSFLFILLLLYLSVFHHFFLCPLLPFFFLNTFSFLFNFHRFLHVPSCFVPPSFLFTSFLQSLSHIFEIQEVVPLLPHATGLRVQTMFFFRHRIWSDLPAGCGMCGLLFRDQTIPSDGHRCLWLGVRHLRLCTPRHHAAGDLRLAGGHPDLCRTDPQLRCKWRAHRVRDQYCANREAICFRMSLIS